MSSEPEGLIVMGRYRIVRRLATGGMGVVYLARVEGAQGFARPAVVKRMLPELSEDEELVRLFVREARILSDLNHPGVVPVLDFVAENGAYLMALEYVHGYHTGHWLKYLTSRNERMDAEIAIYIVVHLLDALHYVHTKTDQDGEVLGIVHRDVTPSNVLIDVEGQVKLLDFGVARTTHESTNVGEGQVSLRGKFPYLAPELLQNDPPSVQTDVYAAAVVLHELLIGVNEFRHSDPTETLRRVLIHDLSRISAWRDDTSPELDRVVARGTARDVKERYETAADFADALRATLETPERAIGARLKERARRDFLGPLSNVLKVPSLDELESAWRDAPVLPAEAENEAIPVVERVTPALEFESQPPRLELTKPALHVEVGGSARSGGWRFAMAGLTVLALVGVGLGAYAVLRAPTTTAGPIVVVDRQRIEGPVENGTETVTSPETVEPAENPPENLTVDGPPPETDPGTAPTTPTGHTPRPPRARDEAAELSARFNRQRGALEGCFERHAAGTQGRPQLSIRFRIAATGHVEGAQLEPAAVAGTPLGQCLTQVARGTDFGPRSGPITFSIPLTVRGQ